MISKRNGRALIAVGFGLLLGVLTVTVTRKKEPSYRGKKLSEWIELHAFFNTDDEAAEAIHHIGTNALPWLVAWIDYEPGKMIGVSHWIYDRLPNRVANSRVLRSIKPRAEFNRPYYAQEAFRALGPLGAPAIPALTTRIYRTNSPIDNRLAASIALAHIGAPAVPAMIEALWSLESSADGIPVVCIPSMGTNARPLVPLIVRNLQHANQRGAVPCAMVLGRLGLEHETVVPALVKSLKDPRDEVRKWSAYALGDRLAPFARSAIPELLNAFQDPNLRVREAATNSMCAIAPELLTITGNPDAKLRQSPVDRRTDR